MSSDFIQKLDGLNIVTGSTQGAGFRVAIAVARFNEFITEALLEGALKALIRNGVKVQDILIARVPGAFELPRAAQQLAESNSVNAVVCLGAVIQGGTPHFEYVCSAATDGILRVGLDTRKPVIFGVLTCDNVEQALERAGLQEPQYGFTATADHVSENGESADPSADSIGRNKGAESALCALEMLTLAQSLQKAGSHDA